MISMRDFRNSSGRILVYPIQQIQEDSSESKNGDDNDESKSTSKLSDDMKDEYTQYAISNFGTRTMLPV